MPSIQIKNVPDETHAVLRQRAARAGQSLQEYLRSKLVADAGRRTLEEIFADVERRRDGLDVDVDELIGAVHDDRSGR